MEFLIGILAMLPIVLAIIAAYYFGHFIESLGVHNTLVVGICMIACGILVWWLLIQYILPSIGIMLGLDKIPYHP